MKSKILDFEVDEKNFKIICMFSIAIILLFCLAVYIEFGSFRNFKIQENMKMDSGTEIKFTIDKVVATRRYIEIEGSAYKQGQDIRIC